jgi:uncharacterized membrane protein YdfJ with MMPL/SSD domain
MMRKTLILAALLLEGVLGLTLIGLVVPALAAHTARVQEAPEPPATPSSEALAPEADASLQSWVFFTRVQTVTLHAPVDDAGRRLRQFIHDHHPVQDHRLSPEYILVDYDSLRRHYP